MAFPRDNKGHCNASCEKLVSFKWGLLSVRICRRHLAAHVRELINGAMIYDLCCIVMDNIAHVFCSTRVMILMLLRAWWRWHWYPYTESRTYHYKIQHTLSRTRDHISLYTIGIVNRLIASYFDKNVWITLMTPLQKYVKNHFITLIFYFIVRHYFVAGHLMSCWLIC